MIERRKGSERQWAMIEREREGERGKGSGREWKRVEESGQ